MGNKFILRIAYFEEVTATVHDRRVHIGCEGGPGYFEENHERIQLVGIDGGLEDEGLEDAIPDIFQLHIPKADPVREKVRPGVKLAELI